MGQGISLKFYLVHSWIPWSMYILSVTSSWNGFLSEIHHSNTIFNILRKFLILCYYFLSDLVCFKDALKAFCDFKNKQKSVWKFIQYSIH